MKKLALLLLFLPLVAWGQGQLRVFCYYGGGQGLPVVGHRLTLLPLGEDSLTRWIPLLDEGARHGLTDSAGVCRFTNLRPGRYRIEGERLEGMDVQVREEGFTVAGRPVAFPEGYEPLPVLEADSSLVDPLVLARMGRDFYRFADSLSEALFLDTACLMDASCIFAYLDRLSLSKGWGVCLRPCERNGFGDYSRFLFYRKIHRLLLDPVRHPKRFLSDSIAAHLAADGSPEAAWQLYLLMDAWSEMTLFWHALNNRCYHFFTPEQLSEPRDYCTIDPEVLSIWRQESDLERLRPSVTRDGDAYIVRCTVHDRWRGLFSDRVRIRFSEGRVAEVTPLKPTLLYENRDISVY